MMHFEPLNRPDGEKFEILRIQDGGGCHLENRKKPYLSRGLSDFDEICYDGAVQPS